MVVFGEVDDGVVDAELADECAFVFGRVTDCVEDTEQIQARDGILMAELLHCAGEDLADGKRCGDWRG